MIRPTSRFLLLGISLGALSGTLAKPAAAQSNPDFLFARPWVSLTFRGGYSAPRAESDIFDFMREQLCVKDCAQGLDKGAFDKGEFAGPTVGMEVAVRATERIDLTLGGGWSGSRTRSEFRNWIGTDGLPISQTTDFVQVPLSVGVKAYLFDRGRSLGRFAWVPARWSPYVGVGAGAVWYRFNQFGEFVDYETLDIFQDNFTSYGFAPSAHVRGGMDFSVHPRMVLTGEARYDWAKTGLDRDFVNFQDIDLARFQATVGLSLRF